MPLPTAAEANANPFRYPWVVLDGYDPPIIGIECSNGDLHIAEVIARISDVQTKAVCNCICTGVARVLPQTCTNTLQFGKDPAP